MCERAYLGSGLLGIGICLFTSRGLGLGLTKAAIFHGSLENQAVSPCGTTCRLLNSVYGGNRAIVQRLVAESKFLSTGTGIACS
jgi:hypothetical protein